jgi:hypothetical protein
MRACAGIHAQKNERKEGMKEKKEGVMKTCLFFYDELPYKISESSASTFSVAPLSQVRMGYVGIINKKELKYKNRMACSVIMFIPSFMKICYLS